jgi:large conductance mechanosensitive channel
MRTEPPVAKTTHPCPQCLSEVPLEAHRCAFCTSPLSPA